MTPAASLSGAIKDIASTQRSTFATTQAVWRFLNNDRVTFRQLCSPLLTLARQDIARSPHDYALVVHDWSHLDFLSHHSKTDRLQITHVRDVGYELRTSLLVDAASGLPVAPLAQTLTDRSGCWSTLSETQSASQPHLDALTDDLQQMAALDALNMGKKLVHIIDREGDSAAHLRALNAAGHAWLVRGKERHRMTYEGRSQKAGDIADGLLFSEGRKLMHRGKPVTVETAEAEVVLTRAAKPKRKDEMTGKRVSPEKGEALSLRLVVVRLVNEGGEQECRWILLTNVGSDISSEEVGNWYYWRWNIESFFKLIKSAGHDVESWLQRSAEALLRRLLIASMACVLAWRVQRGEGEKAAQVRRQICRLSGRQQKRGRRESAPAILAGLSVLLNTLVLLSEYTPEELTRLARDALGQSGDV